MKSTALFCIKTKGNKRSKTIDEISINFLVLICFILKVTVQGQWKIGKYTGVVCERKKEGRR